MSENAQTEQLTNSQYDVEDQTENINSSLMNNRLPLVRRSSDFSDQLRIRSETMMHQNSNITMKRTMVSDYNRAASDFDNDIEDIESFLSLDKSNHLKFGLSPKEKSQVDSEDTIKPFVMSI